MTLKCHNLMMSDLRRSTVYLDPNLRKALRVKAAETEQSVSQLVNAAIRRSLEDDAQDLAVFDARAQEPNLVFENVLKDLKRRGKL